MKVSETAGGTLCLSFYETTLCKLQISINVLLLKNLKTWYCEYGLVTQDVQSEQKKSTDSPRSIAYLGCP